MSGLAVHAEAQTPTRARRRAAPSRRSPRPRPDSMGPPRLPAVCRDGRQLRPTRRSRRRLRRSIAACRLDGRAAPAADGEAEAAARVSHLADRARGHAGADDDRRPLRTGLVARRQDVSSPPARAGSSPSPSRNTRRASCSCSTAPPPAAPGSTHPARRAAGLRAAPATVKTTDAAPIPFSQIAWSPSGTRVAFLRDRRRRDDGAGRRGEGRRGACSAANSRAKLVQWGPDDRTLVVDGARVAAAMSQTHGCRVEAGISTGCAASPSS